MAKTAYWKYQQHKSENLKSEEDLMTAIQKAREDYKRGNYKTLDTLDDIHRLFESL